MSSSPHQSSFTTDRPVAVLMVFLAAVVFGYFSLGRLPVTLMPEMSYPTLTVRTEYPGAAPEEVENDISRPIEEQLGVVGGLNEISSISRAGVSDVVLEFAWGTSMADAIQNTLEKLDTVYLPREAEKPLLLHYDPSLDPVMELSLSAAVLPGDAPPGGAPGALEDGSARRLRRIAELQVKRALEPITGVAAARVRGGLEEEIHVLIDASRLQRIGIPISQVLNRLRAENINSAGGRIREGSAEYMIRTLNEYKTLQEVAETVVYRDEGREIRLRDIGQVVYGQRDREMLTRTDGGESVQIDVYKEADSNMVQVGERIRSAVGTVRGSRRSELAARLFQEEGVVLQVVADRSTFIANSIREVKGTALLGGLLAVGILLAFLRDIRTTAIVAVSIPISIFVTFAPLDLLGVSLNIMSLGGLAMGIGMLVDSSIVVLESIYRCRQEGDGIRTAAIRGTREVRGAVIASTLTSICVFFPMVFVEGMAGQVFSDLGITVVTSLVASLIVAVIFVPMLARRTGFRLQEGTAVASHPLGQPAGRIRPATLFLRVLLPMAGLWVVMAAVHLGFSFWGSPGEPVAGAARRVEVGAVLFRVLRWWGAICAVPALVAVAKVRGGSSGDPGERMGGLWICWRTMEQGRRRGGIPGLVQRSCQAVRMVLAFPLELVGLTLVWVLRTAAWTVALAARAGSVVGRWVSHAGGAARPDVDDGPYPKALRWALRNPAAMLAVMAACFAVTFLVGRQLQSELLPEVHQNEFTFEAGLPVGTPLDQTVGILGAVEREILRRRDELRIATLLVMYGFDTANMKRSDEGEHSARFKVLLRQSEQPRETEERAIAAIREMFRGVPDVQTRVTRPVLFSSKKPVVVQINGEDLAELKQYSDRATALLAGSAELADVEPTLRSGAPEVQIHYDRLQILRHGLTISAVANQVRDMVKGSEATLLNRKDRRVPIMVRLSGEDRAELADVGRITVNPGSPTPVPLRAVARLSVGEGPSEIRRVDGKRVALVQANIGGGSLGAAVRSAESLLQRDIEWPVYMDFLITGQNQEWERSRGSLFLALGLSLFLVYVIMASQFESLVQPFLIMFTIPMAFVGTVLGLRWLGINLSVVVFLGMIMLAGIVVNNAIVLLDYTNTLRARGMGLEDAIVRAGRVRLRPILMTTATTVLGLLPMAFGIGDGAEIRTPMAIAVISGLLTSTVLTLWIIPTLYLLFARAGALLVAPGADPE